MATRIVEHGLPTRVVDAELAGARSKAPSVQEIVGKDLKRPPSVLLFEEPSYLGSDAVSVDRYFDQDIFDREIEMIWKTCWQWVCREDHIPEPGDFYTYEVAHLSYIVVRQADMSVKGFVNSCLHRCTKFKAGEGIGSASDIRCPYHGWTWENDGALKSVPCAWDFGHVDPFPLPLRNRKAAQAGLAHGTHHCASAGRDRHRRPRVALPGGRLTHCGPSRK